MINTKTDTTKLRIILLLDVLEKPRTVRELQNLTETALGKKTKRGTIYDDLACIERMRPLIVEKGKHNANTYQLL